MIVRRRKELFFKIKRRSGIILKPQHIIYFILFYVIVEGVMSDQFGFPSILRYVMDIGIVILMYFIARNKENTIKNTHFGLVFFSICLYTLAVIIGIVINFVPLNLMFWAVRNTYRFFVFFYSCIAFLQKKDIDLIISALYKLQWVHLFLAFYQYLILGWKWDYLGGLFGSLGLDGLGHYSCVMVTLAVTGYIFGKNSLKNAIFTIVVNMLISALAEQKAFYLQFVIIITLALLLSKPSFKKISICGISVSGLLLGLVVLKQVFPGHFAVLMNPEIMELYLGAQGGGYNLSRIGAFSQINDLFFHDDIKKMLFGYGFGNCEYSSIPFFNSDFFEQYGYLNYRWFTHQVTFLETGYVGFITFLLILFSILICSWKYGKKIVDEDKYYVVFSLICTVLCIVSIWQNGLLRNDIAYFAYFTMAVSAILIKENQNKNK